MVTKKIRTEYMKKFRDPKWETFSKCYEDSLKYRLSRRVMEHSHKPWFWEGCECGSDGSSGQSTPRLTRNRVPPPSEEAEVGAGEAAVQVAAVQDATPATGGQHDAIGKEKENRRPSGRLDWTERRADVRTSPNDVSVQRFKQTQEENRKRKDGGCLGGLSGFSSQGHVAAAGLQTRRESDTRRSAVPDRRRARSADLEKARRSQLAVAVAVADDRWMTEYMRCFSARLR
uniref:Centriole, cilia and spindle associated protein n=1 Tax=Scophthalmus maximus TaxID=52904 RepID=A0A8D3ECT9_SCOMX